MGVGALFGFTGGAGYEPPGTNHNGTSSAAKKFLGLNQVELAL